MAKKQRLQNILLWGPPGSGKTTIAFALANETDSHFRKLDATVNGIKELRLIIKFAETQDKKVILAVDEIHRWAKNVQDTLLAAVENGTIILVGLTVETARFAVIKALLSRCLTLETKPLDDASLVTLYKRVRDYYKEQGRPITIKKDTIKKLIMRASGDARKVIMVMETLVEIMSDDGHISDKDLELVMPHKHLFCDALGSEHYDLAHCYQEAIQNSDVNGALYWLAKWAESGEDPAYICRRMLITAFEDCAGNPFAATTAMAASYTTERTGYPECMIPMSLATCEMAMSKRNKSAYYAIKEALSDVQNKETVHVPPGLRAGTTGYVKAIKRIYLKGWCKDWEALMPETNLAVKRHGGIMYAAGVEHSPNEFGMYDGPTPNLNDLLDQEGQENSVIIQFNGDESEEILYRWDASGDRWIRGPSAPI
jgi:putative ATPase